MMGQFPGGHEDSGHTSGPALSGIRDHGDMLVSAECIGMRSEKNGPGDVPCSDDLRIFI